MGKSDDKTNVCRVLDQKKVPYKTHVCPDAEGLSGDEIAAVLNENPAQAFKTLVTVGKTGRNYVFVVPVNKELDLKKAARDFETIMFSACKIGHQVEVKLSDVDKVIRYQVADIVTD